MNGWSREGQLLVAELSAQEAAVLRGLVGQINDMLTARSDEAPRDELAELTGIRTGHSKAPEDRIMARLLPDFFRPDLEKGEPAQDHEDAAAAMRSLHEPELIDLKTGVAGVVLHTCPAQGGEVRISDEQADAWLSAINDVRLALGTALEVDEDTQEELVEDDLRESHLGVYHWLTWVQDNLVQAMAE